MDEQRCKFSALAKEQLFRDPALPHSVMRKLDDNGADQTAHIGQAVINGDEASPTYAYGPNKEVIIV